jgi:hypothetical protein
MRPTPAAPSSFPPRSSADTVRQSALFLLLGVEFLARAIAFTDIEFSPYHKCHTSNDDRQDEDPQEGIFH